MTRDILSYFVRHPRAADTLDGIVRFRVMEELLHRGVPETEAALDRLVERGLLVRETAPGRATLYRLHPQRLEDARRALDSDGPLHDPGHVDPGRPPEDGAGPREPPEPSRTARADAPAEPHRGPKEPS